CLRQRVRYARHRPDRHPTCRRGPGEALSLGLHARARRQGWRLRGQPQLGNLRVRPRRQSARAIHALQQTRRSGARPAPPARQRRPVMKHAPLFALLAGLSLATGVHASAADHVHATHAWIRLLPGALPAGAYVTLENHGDQPVALTGASSKAYAQVMLHHSSTQGGVSRMTMVDSLPVPAHGRAVLAPAGYHLMLMQAADPVKPGTIVRLLLKFGDGSSLPTDFI